MFVYFEKIVSINICFCCRYPLDNPSPFFNPFQFEITFECIDDLRDDLEWRIIYVGSAESEEYDQVLDTVFVGPVPEGRHMFVFQANSPDPSKIPVVDAVGVTVVLLTCSYRGKEFVRVGYYVNNEYMDPELKENPPAVPQFDKLQRNILATDPRITKFKIDWGDEEETNGEEDMTSTDQNGTTSITNGNGSNNNSFEHMNGSGNEPSASFVSEDSIGPLNPVGAVQENSQSMEI